MATTRPRPAGLRERDYPIAPELIRQLLTSFDSYGSGPAAPHGSQTWPERVILDLIRRGILTDTNEYDALADALVTRQHDYHGGAAGSFADEGCARCASADQRAYERTGFDPVAVGDMSAADATHDAEGYPTGASHYPNGASHYPNTCADVESGAGCDTCNRLEDADATAHGHAEACPYTLKATTDERRAHYAAHDPEAAHPIAPCYGRHPYEPDTSDGSTCTTCGGRWAPQAILTGDDVSADDGLTDDERRALTLAERHGWPR